MKNLLYRSTQTQVKHEILARYLDTWGGIIVNGLCHAKRQRIWQFIYVDCFAYKGKYIGDQENIFRHNDVTGPVYGSPVIGIQALDKLADFAAAQGLQIVTNTILVEKDPTHFRDLQATLQECSFDKRARETLDFSVLRNGEIALVNGDVTTLGDKLASYTNRSGIWTFYLIDPFGPSGIPYDFVKEIVKGARHDVMINFIYEDLVRKTGMALNENLEPKHKQLVDYWKNAYGSSRWDQIVVKTLDDIRNYCDWRDVLDGIPLDDMEEEEFMTDEQLANAKERAFVYGYQQALSSMDPGVTIKLSALQFPDKERTMFYLFLTTHDPTGALALNQILAEARYLEYELRYKFNTLRNISRGQMSLWDPIQNVPSPPVEERPATEFVANQIHQRLHGKVLTRKEVYICMADSLFFPSEVDSALKLLKRQGKLLFDGSKLTHRTKMCFAVKSDIR
jgi:three-Cys-motif partner protein